MTPETTTDDDADDGSKGTDANRKDASGTTAFPHSSATYKVLGELAAADGTGVLGHNTATSGAAVGIEGVTDSPNGYGLSTPDDAGLAGVTEIAALTGDLTGTTEVTDLAGDGLAVDGDGALTWTGTYATYTFATSGTTENAVTDLSGATPVEVTVDATDLTAGRVAVEVDGSLRTEAVNGVRHRILEPTSSVTLKSDDFFTFDTSYGISEDGSPQGVAFRSDGSQMFIAGTSDDTVYAYDLPTAWDVDTASYSGDSYVVATENSFITGVRFKPDGTKMFVTDRYAGNEAVYSYLLSTAWDVTSASLLETLDLSSQGPSPRGIAFQNDGSTMFLDGGREVYVYDLLTAWDLGTAVDSGDSFDTSAQTNITEEVAFDRDGTKMYIVDNDDNLYSYVLATPWDVTSAGVPATVDISSQVGGGGAGLATKGDGSKLFVTGISTDNVVQYDTGYGGTAYAAVERE